MDASRALKPCACNEGSPAGEDMSCKVATVEKRMVPPDDVRDVLRNPYNEAPSKQQSPSQAAYSTHSEEASGIDEVPAADEMSAGSFVASVNSNGPDSNLSGGSFVPPHAADSQCSLACLSLDSIEEIASNLSVEEKQPLNTAVAQARSRTLHLTSEEMLRAYQYLKRIVQQRIYRQYYVKWVHLLTQRPPRAVATQTAKNDYFCAPVVGGAVYHSEAEGAAADVALPSLPHSASECGSKHTARDDARSECTQGGLREGQQGLSASTPSASVTCLFDPVPLPIKPPSPLLLRSRGAPTLLHDYGRQSSTPRRISPRFSSLPSVTLPSLTSPSRQFTVCQTTTHG
ncbi:hypothetical protein TraAM80_05464 [Trypanosoma rangeli]|uniref:Uncharacterized protein n=1 Tax=Trypanosoma rangeli TaxID=5698 RepID=A0A422NEX4_TRYRA|nr:uncharacterized protein TraAM80_05464 [Trypanosoma rangeli]RNF04014.1 hypothetical protein TraAM80_05464 [Trypanosoma rangeli]|eukprot:RNF04014.1 hypothetical protein TraAM80_05464 [Trypanosoma rangeli]